jgi:hypothetical protein
MSKLHVSLHEFDEWQDCAQQSAPRFRGCTPSTTSLFFPLYGNALAAVHPNVPELPEATTVPFSTVETHRLDATQYAISR